MTRPKTAAKVTDTASHATISQKPQFTYRTPISAAHLLPTSRQFTREITRSHATLYLATDPSRDPMTRSCRATPGAPTPCPCRNECGRLHARFATRDLVYATDTIAEQVDELQFTLREGP